MAASSYREVGAMHVCAPTNHFSDINTLLAVVADYKRLGGKVPPDIEAALELAKAGSNVEQSLNLACTGLFKFYVAQTLRCAREAGFASLEAYEAERRTDPSGGRVIRHEDCVLKVERRWQAHNVNFTINPLNPESALRQFIARTTDQVIAIVSRYVKKSAVKRIESGQPRRSP